ncbi:MAG: radical SAM family heme chaperone HemW [Bdellovibrionales bacterium]|nr:radical SAM family heme chaperone HemW [Bdellovibrionales bacterium]
MAFGVYIHIPYCVQRCHYCDFTTFEKSRIMPMEDYLQILLKELRKWSSQISEQQIDTIYFGGGTPSLLPAEHIVSILDTLATVGSFHISSQCEVTLEINPATVDESKLDLYRGHGVNRYSVGAQTFNPEQLKRCGRIHSAQDTRNTLRLLEKYDLNYSFDLLFGLPFQTLMDLESDLQEAQNYAMPHLSAYCLTVPQGHPMSTNRAEDDVQIQMFQIIEQRLKEMGLLKYEISNFAKPGNESRHNMLYWTDQSYWGIGISAHSYLRSTALSPYGSRFWNPKDFPSYLDHIENASLELVSAKNSYSEHLLEHESMTDFCHTQMRLSSGLSLIDFESKFPKKSANLLPILEKLASQELIEFENDSARLTKTGEGLSNLVFSELTFMTSS